MGMIDSIRFESPTCKCEPQDPSKWVSKEEPGYTTVHSCTVCGETWKDICPPNTDSFGNFRML
tara:strand:+ start:550 stop:738 length:189 start_codon:yes stop_codon:yes gene_type:complete